MSKCFGSVNEVDSHSKSRQSDLALDKFWVTQCVWLRLCNNVAVGMKINNFWKLFWYGVKKDHYDNFIGIREFSKRIAADCFNNTFTTDTGTLSKNILSLDEIDNEGTVSYCRRLNYSIYFPRNSEISTILDITIATAPTTAVDHTSSKEVQLEGRRYNRADRGYCHRRLPNGNICLKKSL